MMIKPFLNTERQLRNGWWILTSFICQFLRRKPLAELLGKWDRRWVKELCLGGLTGLALMLSPALLLWVFWWVDWRVNLDAAWAELGGVAVQGNLDPATSVAPWPAVERRAADVLDRAAGRPGHIFNLGHGIMTETPVDTVRRLVDFVHGYSRKGEVEQAAPANGVQVD